MKFSRTLLPDVWLIEPVVFSDERGAFLETWEFKKFSAVGIHARFVQDNHSVSHQWVLRGLHYQIRHPQGKLVRVTRGRVFDVAVDLRRSSSTFGKWVGHELSAENRLMMWVPPGFAHGYLALSPEVEFLYKCTDFYDRESERSLSWRDPTIGIEWPLPDGAAPILSPKDRDAATIESAECFP